MFIDPYRKLAGTSRHICRIIPPEVKGIDHVGPSPLLYLHMAFFVYILRSLKDGSYYVGSTQDLEPRLKHHNEVGTQYTKQKRPWELVYTEEHPDRSSAMQREYAIKKHGGKQFIESLIKKSRPMNKD